MPLSADQEAMLQLLLERGQSYGDLAALLGASESEVRSRARAALSELGGADPDRNVGLTDWLLGQADPIGRADAVRHLKDDPGDHGLARELLEKLREVAPEAELPKLPAEPRGGFLRRSEPSATASNGSGATAAPAAAADPSAVPPTTAPPEGAALPAPSGTGLTGRQARLLVGLASAALTLLVAVLAITGAFGGGSEEEATPTAATGTDGTAGTDGSQGAGQEIATIQLRPTGGGDVSGEATFGTADGAGYVDLTVQGLDPAPQGEAYILWLLLTERMGHPLAPVPIDTGGSFEDRIEIPDFVVEVAARTRFVDISLAPSRELGRRILEAATAEQVSPVLDYVGSSVLRGAVVGRDDSGGRGAGSGDGGAGSGGSGR
jgi:hypothetical protein